MCSTWLPVCARGFVMDSALPSLGMLGAALVGLVITLLRSAQ